MSKITPQRSKVSHTPFATVGKGGKCPSCGWEPDGGGLFGRGITTALRIHCYREHGLRLVAGVRSRLPSETASPIDLDTEFTAHLWVIGLAVRNWSAPSDDEIMQEAHLALLTAILQWDSRRSKSFRAFAIHLIQQRAGKAAKKALRSPCSAGTPLRVMLPTPLNPAATLPLATPADAAREARSLTDVQRTVLSMRFSESPATLSEIAGFIGLSKERIRQIETEALSILRVKLVGQPTTARKRRKCKARVSTKSELPLFAVMWGESPTRMDDFGLLRRVDWDVMSVFTDRKLASRIAGNHRTRLHKRSNRRPEVRVVPVAHPAGRQELVDSPPARLGMRDAMTADAVRDEMARHGPMTVAQIARRLVARDGYMETRHPSADSGDESRAAGAVRLAMKSGCLHMHRIAPCLYAMDRELKESGVVA